jgi:hypothetical protein
LRSTSSSANTPATSRVSRRANPEAAAAAPTSRCRGASSR